MKTHCERVFQARLMHEEKIRRIRRMHTTNVTGIFVMLIVFILLGAYVPGFYQWIDSTPPMVQVIVLIIPIGVFAFWRLKKMVKL